MKNYKHNILPLALTCALFMSCSDKKQNNKNDIASPVSVSVLKKGSINQLINTTGNTVATYSAELKNEVAGYYNLQINPTTKTQFKLGDKVKKGELIIRIEDKEFENGIAIIAKKLAVEIAENEKVKLEALHKKGGVTLSEIRSSEVKATNSRYSYDNALIQLEKMNVTAPFDGVIVSLPHYTKGARIESNKPVLGVMDYSKLYMDINLPESTIRYIKANQPIFVTHYTLANDTIKGIVSELSPAISTETRTYQGRIVIDNKGLKIRPGMFVKVDILVDRAEQAIIIPKDIIQSRYNRKFVYVIEKNTAKMRSIQTGLEDENNVEVTQGLKVDDNLVIKGYETLRENSKVKVQK